MNGLFNLSIHQSIQRPAPPVTRSDAPGTPARCRIPHTTRVICSIIFYLFVLTIGWRLALPLRLAQAAGITVNNTADTVATDGQCTLREAIINANNDNQSGSIDCAAGSGFDTLTFNLPAGSTLTLSGTQLFTITSNLTIDGTTAISLTISGANSSRIFEIGSSGVVTLTTLTIVNGYAGMGNGGGILNSGQLTLINSIVSNNLTYNGGGIFSSGVLTLTNSLISDNSALMGGGIYSSNRLTVINSAINDNNNYLATFPGCIDTYPPSLGGSDDPLCYIGSGIHNTGSLMVTNTVISGNSGGGVYNTAGGIYNSGSLSLINSTISSNSAAASGGGIYNTGSSTLTNTTISGNAANINGGGIRNRSGMVAINNVTLAYNLADADNDGFGDGGGLLSTGSTVRLKNTLIAHNTDPGRQAPDCSGNLISEGYNLISTPLGCTLTGTPTGNIIGQAQQLSPLADHGGVSVGLGTPLLTHALLLGPAIDTGNNATCAATDQHGLTRPQGTSCDIGAYEASPGLTIAKSVTPRLAIPGQTITYTLTFRNNGAVTAGGVIITDPVPTGQVSAWSYTNSGAAITNTGASPAYVWQVANLAPGAGGIITLTGIVNPGLTSSNGFTNTTTVTSTAMDADLTDNTASAGLPACLAYQITVTSSTDGGPGTLRQAITDLCPNGAIDFNFTTPTTITLTSGPLTIAKSLIINGSPAPTITISSNNGERAFQIINPDITVAISNLIMVNRAGGIVNYARLTLTHIAINQGSGLSNYGNLTLSNSTLKGNSANYGGGIRNYGVLTVTNSTMSDNYAFGGGGLYNTGVLTLTSSLVISNSGGDHCPYFPDCGGGGILNGGTLMLVNSAVSNNSAGVGGGILNYGTLEGINSTISGNTDTEDGFTYSGGGIFNLDTLSLTNSTISNNLARDSIFDSGGGVFNANNSLLTLLNVTIANNTVGQAGVINYGMVNMQNTLIANNSWGDCWGTLTSQGYNLIENIDGCSLTGNTSGNITGQDPQLGPLANNGGGILTHALSPGSPAIDAAAPANFPPTDQRGVSRPQPVAGQADIGAYEYEILPTTLSIGKSGPASAGPGDLITYTLTITNSGTASAINLVITDAIPTAANYITGGTKVGDVVKWMIPVLPLSATTQVSFVVTAATTITNSDYQVTASGGYNASGSIPVVTSISAIGEPILTISKTGPPTATTGDRITYTLTITNSGVSSATNLVITDAIPTGANYIAGGTKIGPVIRWIVPTLPLSATTQVSFVVIATTTITNSDYRVSASGGYSATGNIPVVTIINTNAPIMQKIHLPVIFKQ